jgi:hypothetical protein
VVDGAAAGGSRAAISQQKFDDGKAMMRIERRERDG